MPRDHPTGVSRSAARSLAVLVAFAVASGTLASPAIGASRKRGRTYVVSLPASVSGTPRDAPTSLPKLPDLLLSAGPAPRAQPKILLVGVTRGTVGKVMVEGFWRGAPAPGEPGVKVRITGPGGRRARLVIERRASSSEFLADPFEEGADRIRLRRVPDRFDVLWAPDLPLGRYVVSAVAGTKKAALAFVLRPATVPHVVIAAGRSRYPVARPGEPVRVTMSGFAAEEKVGITIYRERDAAAPGGAGGFDFFAEVVAVPVSEDGWLEMDVATDNAVPGHYCFVVDRVRPASFRCPGVDTVLITD